MNWSDFREKYILMPRRDRRRAQHYRDGQGALCCVRSCAFAAISLPAMATRLIMLLIAVLAAAANAFYLRPPPIGSRAAASAAVSDLTSRTVVAARSTQKRTASISMNKVKLTNGGKSCQVAAGSSMLAACKKLGINVKTNCKKGDCGTCTVRVGGKAVKACVGKVPPAPKLKSVMEKGLPVSR